MSGDESLPDMAGSPIVEREANHSDDEEEQFLDGRPPLPSNSVKMASFLIKLTLGALILLAYAAHSSPLGTFKKDSFMDSAWKFGQEHMLKLIAVSVFLIIFLVWVRSEKVSINRTNFQNSVLSDSTRTTRHGENCSFWLNAYVTVPPAGGLGSIQDGTARVVPPAPANQRESDDDDETLPDGWCGCVKECKWYLQLLACILFYCPIPFVCGYIAFKNWSWCALCWSIGFVTIIFLGCLNIGIFLCCVNMDNIIKRKVPPRGEAWNRFMNFLRGNQGQKNHAEAGGAGAAAPGNNPPGQIEMNDMSTSVVDEPSSHNA